MLIRTSENQSAPVNQDTAGPSDLQSFSDTLRSRLQSASMKYKDSITKSTRGWKERWFSRSNTISGLGTEVRREVNAGIAAVSRMMERLETKDDTGPSAVPAASACSPSDANNQRTVSPNHAAVVNETSSTTCASGSGSQ
jgi:E3 ubiquitin-protein ligase RHF